MWSSRLFWRIFLVYAALSFIAATGFVFILSSHQRDAVHTQVERRLHDAAVVLRSAYEARFPQRPTPELDARIMRLGAENNARITLIAADGTVVADSDPETASPEMENHGNRPEVIMARQSGQGVATRDSSTLGISMTYFALPVYSAGALQGFVRVAVEVESVERQVARVQQMIWGTAVGVTLVALAFTYFIVRRLIRPLSTLTEAAQAMTAGDFSRSVDFSGHDEFATLSAAFNRMSRELSDRIADLHRKGAELRENSDLLSTVLGAMIEGVVVVDDRQNILFANRAARPLLNFETGNVIGKSLFEAARHPTVQATVSSVLKHRTPHNIEFEVPRSESIVSLAAIALPGDPCPGAVLVLHDITELRRLENIRREFVSNVSHELKTPLSAIHAFAETLLDGAVDDPSHNRQFLERILEQSERLHSLILELISLARIESGQEVFDIVPVLVAEIVESCIDAHRPLAESKSVAILVEPPQDPLQVLADSEALGMLLGNLIDNAIKYTPSGGRVLLRWSREGSQVSIQVADSGVGIPKSHQSRIFERFYRVDKARSREMGGTGLGLSIVKHLTQVFGGSIDVSSVPGHGSTFTVKLPAAALSPANTALR